MLTDCVEDVSLAIFLHENALAYLKFVFGWKGIDYSIYEISVFYGFRLF